MASATPTHGEIRSDAAYPLPDFMAINGIGTKTMRRARREGLPVTRVGRRAYVMGRDWLAYLDKKATQ